MKRRGRKRRGLGSFLSTVALIAILALWTAWGNTALMRTDIEVASAKLPKEFDVFVIAQISDLHDALIGEDNSLIAEITHEANPDIIVLTGDMVDSNRVNIERSLNAILPLTQIAPVYYVNGNHEAALSYNEYRTFTAALKQAGVTLLEDESVFIERNGAYIKLIGLNDPGFLPGSNGQKFALLQSSLSLLSDDGFYNVTLAHRPELIDYYVSGGADLVLSGHAHGGQFRLPFIGGLFSPGQGFLPKYDAGLYNVGGVQMAVSRGIGNSKFPFRFNNRPEIVVITLKRG